MENAIAVLSWVVTILFPLVILSMPVEIILERRKKNWKQSKAKRVYKLVQFVSMGILGLAIVIVSALMVGTF